MAEKQTIDAMWDDSPVDVSTEVNFIWSIANKLRGTYQSDKYKDVIIPMVIIRRFECALAPTKQKVVDQFKANPAYPAKAMYRVSGYQFYNTSEFDLAELVNDADHLAANFKSYIQGFSANIQDIIKSLDFDKQIDKMDKNNRLLSVVKAFSELDLNPVTTLAYNGLSFSVPKRLHIIGMMNTADRSLAMIDYALRRRFSFFDMEPGFDSEGFINYQNSFANETFNTLIERIKELNKEIAQDKSLGKGFCIGHSYFCNADDRTEEWMKDVVDFDILPMLSEYWFDESSKLQRWENILHGVFQ